MSAFPQDITLNEAHTLIKPLMQAIALQRQNHEEVFLEEALNRTLAEDLISSIDVPMQNTSAVDGYAFHYEDNIAPLPITGSIKAGHPLSGEVMRGYAYRIFTGAIIPKSLDTVAMQEHCRFNEDGNLILPQNLERGANYRPCGENVAKGEIVMRKGTAIGPAEIGLAAAIGCKSVRVMPEITIALLSVGDEIAETGSPDGFEEGMVFDSNRPMLKSMMQDLGHNILDYGIVKDDLKALTKSFLHAAKNADVILISGGSSEGEEDHTKSAIIEAGGVIDFWRLALKPGRPMISGRIGKAPIFGLPGNPVAAFVCTRLIVEPMLGLMQGGSGNLPPRIKAFSGFAKPHRKGRAEYLRARLEDGSDGLRIVINGKPGAGVLSSLTGADGLVEIPADHDDVKKGDLLPFLMFREAGL